MHPFLRPRLSVLLLAALLVGRAAPGGESVETEISEKTGDIIFTFSSPQPEKALDMELPAPLQNMERIRDFRYGLRGLLQKFKDLPEGHTLRLVVKFYADFGHRFYSTTQLDKDGEPHGVQQFYHPAPRRIVTWKHGVKHGPEIHSDLRGRKKVEIPWADGVIRGTKKTFYPTGEVRTETEYVDGKAHGETRTYSPEGKVLRKGEYVEGDRHGKLIDYFPRTDGQPRRIVPYVEGKVHGTVKEFYENGNPKRELPFVEDRMHGVEKEYDGEGNLENTAYWYEGDRVSKDVYRQRAAEAKKKGES